MAVKTDFRTDVDDMEDNMVARMQGVVAVETRQHRTFRQGPVLIAKSCIQHTPNFCSSHTSQLWYAVPFPLF